MYISFRFPTQEALKLSADWRERKQDCLVNQLSLRAAGWETAEGWCSLWTARDCHDYERKSCRLVWPWYLCLFSGVHLVQLFKIHLCFALQFLTAASCYFAIHLTNVQTVTSLNAIWNISAVIMISVGARGVSMGTGNDECKLWADVLSRFATSFDLHIQNGSSELWGTAIVWGHRTRIESGQKWLTEFLIQWWLVSHTCQPWYLVPQWHGIEMETLWSERLATRL
jgi:hypothetical protein